MKELCLNTQKTFLILFANKEMFKQQLIIWIYSFKYLGIIVHFKLKFYRILILIRDKVLRDAEIIHCLYKFIQILPKIL